MEITFQKLTQAELEIFIRMRITQLTEEYEAEGTFVSWLAMDGGKIVGTSGMSFVEKPPYFSCPSGRLGLLSSMYTDPEYRRRGIARNL